MAMHNRTWNQDYTIACRKLPVQYYADFCLRSTLSACIFRTGHFNTNGLKCQEFHSEYVCCRLVHAGPGPGTHPGNRHVVPGWLLVLRSPVPCLCDMGWTTGARRAGIHAHQRVCLHHPPAPEDALSLC